MEFCAKLNIGGAQAFASNISKYADDSFHFCYVVFGDDIGEYEESILRQGNRIVHIPGPSRNPLAFIAKTVRLMKEEQCDVVHAHTMFSCGIIMAAAWLAGVPGRISHSHTTNDDTKKTAARRIYFKLMRGLIRLFATDYLACGVGAGNALYGQKWFSRRGKVIRNGIDTSKYHYSAENRERLRRQLNVQDRFVIGHVGHYEKVKNQAFLIRLMGAIHKEDPNAILLMFGEGSERERLQELIAQHNMQDCARLMGNASNIPELLSAMDVFAFPSLYEGTPIALIEAQTNGLPCVISSAIPGDACLLDSVRIISLDAPESEWIQAILSAERMDPAKAEAQIARSYGTISSTMEELYNLFRQYKRKRVGH